LPVKARQQRASVPKAGQQALPAKREAGRGAQPLGNAFEFLRPTKEKAAIAIAIGLVSYLLLMATQQTYDVPVVMLSEGGPGGSSFSMEMAKAVQFNPAVMAALFPVSSFMMFAAFGGMPTNFSCTDALACDIATGRSWLFLAALALNLPYYYWLACLASPLIEKVLK